MLDQLVESNVHTKENARRGSFLLSTFIVVCSIFLSGILWSLFAKDLKLGAGDFEISTIVAPPQTTENEPRPPSPKPEKPEQSSKAVTETTRQSNMARIDETQFIPKGVSTVLNNLKARPVGNFVVSNGAELEKQGTASATFGRENNNPGTGIVFDNAATPSENIKAIKPPPLKIKETSKPPIEMRKSLGVVNGIARNLVKPPYPPTAKTVQAAGAVNVQVTIDEKGNVIAANAVSGHPLLRQASEAAARASKFNPTLLSNQPVKVTGLIIYKFVAQ